MPWRSCGHGQLAHPDHHPIFITLEPKDAPSKNPELTVPELFTEKIFDEVDKTMREYSGNDQIITPDIVRGKYPTLEDAVLHDNWPTLKQARGKFLFVLDDKDRKRRFILFANADPGTPESAMMIRNNPKTAESASSLRQICQL